MLINRRNMLLTGTNILVGAAFGLFSPLRPAVAHEYELGNLKIEHPWLRYPKEGETTAPLYMFIHNNGDTADKLIGAKSEKVGKFVIHADPRQIIVPHGIIVPPKSTVTLSPTGQYVEMIGVTKMNPVGWGFELDLIFEKAGQVTIDAAVDAPDAQHAHDAEAMQRWEAGHPSTSGGAPAAQETDHDHMDHGSIGATAQPSEQPK